MKKIIGILLFTVSVNILSAQELTINQYFNGIWKRDCCDSDYFFVFYNNKLFWVHETMLSETVPDNMYCFPKVKSYMEFYETGKPLAFKNLSKDSIDFDRYLHLKDGREIIEVVYYNIKDTLYNGSIVHYGPIYFQITPQKFPNNFVTWNFNSSQKLVYYGRILNPPLKVLKFYKKIAADRFKTVSRGKTKIFSKPDTPTQMYLVKGDETEVLFTKNDWLQIRYYGKKTVEGWIKTSDVE